MTARRLGLAAGAALAALLLVHAAARADTHEVSGERLVLTTGGEDVTVNTDSSLRNTVRVETAKDGCAGISGGATVTVETTGCDDDGDVTLYVPRGFAITLTTAGDGNVRLGNELGDVVATITSDGDVYAGHVHSLVLGVHGSGDAVIDAVDGAATLDMTGSGDVRLKSVNGLLSAHLRGSGDLAVGGVHAPAAEITGESSGDIVLGEGSIGALTAKLHGSGDLLVAATVGVADLTASGGGDIRLAKVSGVVRKDASGGSSISTAGISGMTEILAKLATADGDKLSGLSKLAHDSDRAGGADDDDNNPLVVHLHHSSSHDGGGPHLLTIIILAGIAWVAFNWVRQNGGFAQVRARFIVPGTSGPVSIHPGVAAVKDVLARLEGRLGRVEGYVTSREFDLQQKFRDLDKKSP